MVEVKLFEGKTFLDSLEQCARDNHKPLCMPELIDQLTDMDDETLYAVLQEPILTSSMITKGKGSFYVPGTNGHYKMVVKTEVFVLTHHPTKFSDPDRIREYLDANSSRDITASFSETEFNDLLSLVDGKHVYAFDPNDLDWSKWRRISSFSDTTTFLNHPLIAPYLGGKKRAEQFFRKCFEAKKNWRGGVRQAGVSELLAEKIFPGYLYLDSGHAGRYTWNTLLLSSNNNFTWSPCYRKGKIYLAGKK